MVITVTDWKEKYKPIINSKTNNHFFSISDKEVRENTGDFRIWNINNNQGTMQILPNNRQFSTLGLCAITEKTYTQNDEENLKVEAMSVVY